MIINARLKSMFLRTKDMYRFLGVIPVLLLMQAPAVAQANPYQIGMEYCGMVKNGISRGNAWDYVIKSYVTNSSNSGDPYAPWSPTRTFGGAIGSGLASGIAAGFQLRAMRGDIQAVINSNCPEMQQIKNDTVDNINQEAEKQRLGAKFCDFNPWLDECKFPNKQDKEKIPCDLVLQKFECSYKKYLSANINIKNWAKINPEMAMKEAVKLGAADAESFAIAPKIQPNIKIMGSPIKKEIENICLKALDCKGCMEYSNKR